MQANGGGLIVHTARGKALPADMALLVVGVKPETGLAKEAGLQMGQRGIAVDAHMRTSDPSIYAVGEFLATLSVYFRNHG
jgi:NAD(P)H-nitrite reductase large subunit